jgi:hypothetical protein
MAQHGSPLPRPRIDPRKQTKIEHDAAIGS